MPVGLRTLFALAAGIALLAAVPFFALNLKGPGWDDRFCLSGTFASIDKNGKATVGRTLHLWYESPQRWRWEMVFGNKQGSSIILRDGSMTLAEPLLSGRVVPVSGAAENFPKTEWRFVQTDFVLGPSEVDSLKTLLEKQPKGYEQSIRGEDSVVFGRPAYVVKEKAKNFEATTWIDKETFFVLRWDENGQLQPPQVRARLTKLVYNPAFDDSTFKLTTASIPDIPGCRAQP